MAKTRKKRPSRSPGQVLLVADDPSFRDGLMQLMAGEKDLAVSGQAATADQAFRSINRRKPDLVVVDVSLPGKTGLELIKKIRSEYRKIKILAVSMRAEARYAVRALRAGANGYILKQEDTDDIVYAMRDVLRGHIYVSEEVLASMPKVPVKHTPKAKMSQLDSLTDSQVKIAELLGLGKSNRRISRQLLLTIGPLEEPLRSDQKN